MMAPRLKKIILLRLFFAALLFLLPQVDATGAETPYYAASLGIALLTLLYLGWYLTKRRLPWLALFQISLDVLLLTSLATFTGGAESLFAVFFPLTILSTALVLGERRLVHSITVLSCVGYFAASFLAPYFKLTESFSGDPLYFFYGVGMRMGIFLGVGLLSRRLSETVSELREKLKLSERLSLLGEAASTVAHEVKNPLSSIRTASEVLKDSLAGKLDAQQEKMLAIVEGEADRLTKTLQRILSYAKQVKPNPRMMALDPLVERVLDLARLRLHGGQKNGVHVEKKFDSQHTKIYADEEQLIAALLNLVLNAYQAMPEGGGLEIGAEEKREGTRVSVKDTGGGIPPEKKAELFQPFKTTKRGGTGLGLAEVHKIVTLHEGKIVVESKAREGTAFHLFFPKP